MTRPSNLHRDAVIYEAYISGKRGYKKLAKAFKITPPAIKQAIEREGKRRGKDIHLRKKRK